MTGPPPPRVGGGVGPRAVGAAPAGSEEPAAQKERPVVRPECAKFLFRVSFISMASFIVASALRVYDGMVVTAAVLLCSTNHWRRPVYGVRRNVDIVNTMSCLAYQTWRCFAAGSLYTAGYLVFSFIGVVFFFLGLHLDKSNTMHGTYAHSFVHILGNVGNIILYVGLSRPVCR
jgi:hypothetical protein